MQYLNDGVEAGAERFVLVHGFTQNSACMRPFASHLEAALGKRLAAVAMIDAPGHGASEHDDADLIDAAALLVEAGENGHYVGYSMGGRMLLHAALLFPEHFRSLTLVGVTAGIDDGAERAKRMVADDQLAERMESEGLESFIDFWLGLDLFSSLPAEAAGRDERLTNRVAGLASSLRQCGTGSQYPLWRWLEHLHVPVQVIAGASDAKFTALGQRMVEALPNGQFASAPGGHAVHSEAPEVVAGLVARFSFEVEQRLRS